MKHLYIFLFLLAQTAGLFAAATPTVKAPELLSRRYRLRSGDSLEVQYRLTSDLNQTVIVQPDGYINLNVAGEVRVSGLSLPEARTAILHAVEDKLKDPELNLVLREFTRPSVIVAGEVFKPGQIEIKEDTTALGAVLMAGGFTETAQTGQILVFRKVDDELAEVKKVNLTHMKRTSDLERNLLLQPGDMIYVPRDKIAKLERYIKIVNTGAYFNPLQNVQ